MTQPERYDTQADDLEVMATVGPWSMVTWKDDGIAVKHEFFFINTEDQESKWPELAGRIGKINSLQTMGKGFTLKYFTEPKLGCHVMVKEGWQMTNPVQSRLFLEQFLKLIN